MESRGAVTQPGAPAELALPTDTGTQPLKRNLKRSKHRHAE